jgi:hypothetical protein
MATRARIIDGPYPADTGPGALMNFGGSYSGGVHFDYAMARMADAEPMSLASVRELAARRSRRSKRRSRFGSVTYRLSIGVTYDDPASDNKLSSVLGLLSKITALGSFAPPPAGSVLRGMSAALGFVSYMSDEKGQPILGTAIKAKGDALAGELLKRVPLARKTTYGLGLLLVSDYGKLSTAFKKVDSTWSLDGNPEVARTALLNTSKQWFYEELIPTAYPYLIRANGNNARYLDCRNGSLLGWPNQPDMFQMNATVGYDTSGKPITNVFFFTQGQGGASSPPASLGDEMFRPRNDGGLGMEKLQFFTPRVFNGTISHAVNGVFSCGVGTLPDLR